MPRKQVTNLTGTDKKLYTGDVIKVAGWPVMRLTPVASKMYAYPGGVDECDAAWHGTLVGKIRGKSVVKSKGYKKEFRLAYVYEADVELALMGTVVCEGYATHSQWAEGNTCTHLSSIKEVI